MKTENNTRPRARDVGVTIGKMPTGALNAITDVPGVKVGHVALIEGEGKLIIGRGPIRTGVTAIVPHSGNIFTEKVCAAAHIINAFGKSVGLPQVIELGNIETPIMLTNTLNVWTVADAVVDYIARQNEGVYSFNPVVGECNDSGLNDILGRHVKREHVFQALENASETNVEEGNVGAGVGMTGFGWKGGIGTASRLLPKDLGDFTLGVMVLTNTGAATDLRIDGIPVGRELTPDSYSEDASGSIMIIVATDAPLSARQLSRVARRAAFGLARTGATASHGSGDFVIAFSTGNRISAASKQAAASDEFVPEHQLSSLFRAVIEATEEAIVNSILKAETMTGRDGNTRVGIPIERVIAIISKHR
ncbi:MAG: P1 family peptidase [Candidatus Poribacteria bacterium]